MNHLHIAIVSLGLALGLVDSAPQPARKGPNLPPLPTTPTIPVVPLALDTVVILPEGVEYVIDHTSECVVASFPSSRLLIKKRAVEKGQTLILTGRFLEGDKVVTKDREFTGPCYLYRVTAVESGPCELMVLPIGGGESELIRRRIDAQHASQPPPKPVDPIVPPKPVPSPIDADGLHVLVLYQPHVNLPAAQNSILYGKKVRDYLEANCPVGPDGVTKQYRIWPSNVDARLDHQLWQAALKRPIAGYPWVIVGNRKVGGYEGQLPENAEKFIELVSKYK